MILSIHEYWNYWNGYMWAIDSFSVMDWDDWHITFTEDNKIEVYRL